MRSAAAGGRRTPLTNQELFLAIGIPMLFNGVLIGLMWNALSARITSLETNLNARIGTIETSTNARTGSLETRMLNLENTMTTRFDLLMGRLNDLEKEIHRH